VVPDRLARVVQLLSRLPGVGEKTAQRYALFLATTDPAVSRELGRALADLCELVRPCVTCGHIADVGDDGIARCSICRDPRRDDSMLCIVARVQDLLAIERSGAMRGRYFVLGGLLSPLDGVSAEDLPLERLRQLIENPERPITEVVVATPPSVDGEATALLLSRELAALGVRVSRIASGVPHGGDLEFADQVTLGRAIEGRKSLS
jgi:recombination protein RecR